jgi:hypothetical protein
LQKRTTFGLLLLVLILAVPAFSAGYQVAAKEQSPTAADPTGVLAGHGSRPAIHPPQQQGLPLSLGFSNQTSSNWSGYVVLSNNGSVTDVNGSWIEPRVSCSSFNSYAAFWVGIDGWTNDGTVEQIGTDSDCMGGSPTYYAWYEFYPAAGAFADNITVSAGDVISAMVSCQTNGLQCTVSITDVTNGQSFSNVTTFNPGTGPELSSAEWIAEAPSTYNSQVLPLAAFGEVHLGRDSTGVSSSNFATVNGTSGPIGSFSPAVIEVTMLTPEGSTEAQPSQISGDGTSFSVVGPEFGSNLSPPRISASPTIVGKGHSAALSTKTSFIGGLPPYTCQWLEEPPGGTGFSDLGGSFRAGCTPSSKPSVTTGDLTTLGTWRFELRVTDAADAVVTSSPATLTVKEATKTAVSCAPTSVPAASSMIVTCRATVSGHSPEGTLTWAQGGTGSVSFVTSKCKLSKGSCSVTLKGSKPGTTTFTATYSGDSLNMASSGTGRLTVTRAPTTITLSCAKPTIAKGAKTTCTATVSGSYSSRTGTVTWSDVSGAGRVMLSKTTCTLSSGRCSVTVTATAGGRVTIEATYGGDSDNVGSSGKATLKIS